LRLRVDESDAAGRHGAPPLDPHPLGQREEQAKNGLIGVAHDLFVVLLATLPRQDLNPRVLRVMGPRVPWSESMVRNASATTIVPRLDHLEPECNSFASNSDRFFCPCDRGDRGRE